MDTQRWDLIESILDDTLEQPEEEREAYVRSRCKKNHSLAEEILELLSAIEASQQNHFLNKASAENKALLQDIIKKTHHSSFIGRKIGAYKITERIGRGGMGSVFKAERADKQFQQTVAIKIVRQEFSSSNVLKQFEIEKQVLAKLSHPNIANIFDGGITKEGHPYLIMEFVDGMSIDAYCNSNKLSIGERLQLFEDVCHAVEYAHRNLIIHCDLKAKNIYITTNGVVKILDFGIVKLLNTDLIEEEMKKAPSDNQFWTPHYAAPEQVKEDTISTATDVYALGVLLHKLLTNHFPFDFTDETIAQISSIITNNTPDTLSASLAKSSSTSTIAHQRSSSKEELQKMACSDLAAITTKALSRSADHRYPTVSKLLDDLDKYKNNLPVYARKPTYSYRLKKFANRNKRPLTAAFGIILLLLSFVIFYTHQIKQEKNYAQRQAQKAKQLTTFLMDIFEANYPAKNKGKTVTAGELLVRAEKRAEMLSSQPAIQAQMFDVIGQIYRRLGEFEKAKQFLKNGLKIRLSTLGAHHLATLSSMDHLGILLTETGNFQAADSLLRKTLQLRQQFLDPTHLSIAITQSNLAYAYRREGFYTKAESLYHQSLQLLRGKLGKNHPRTIETLSSLGTALHYQGNYEATENIFRNVLAQRRKKLGPIHPDLAQSINNLGAVLMNEGQFKEAETLFREALKMRTTLYGPRHPKVSLMMNNLGIVLYNQNEFKAAASFFEKALTMRKNLFGDNSISTGITLFSLGKLMLKKGQADSALVLFEQAHTIFANKYSKPYSLTARAYLNIGSAYLGLQKFDKASHYLETGFQKIKNIHSPSSLAYILAEIQFSLYLLKDGQLKQAQFHFNHILETLEAIEGKKSPRQKYIQGLIERSNKLSVKVKAGT